MKAERMPKSQQNVFGEPIELCCEDPLTGDHGKNGRTKYPHHSATQFHLHP